MMSPIQSRFAWGFRRRSAKTRCCRFDGHFDPAKRRAGIPDDVAALVEKLSADETIVTLVNVNPCDERTLLVQAGCYAEHQFGSVRLHDRDVAVDAPRFSLRLGPGAGARLSIKMRRYANAPTMVLPWE